jgi:cytochrome c-type biogenesis protein CcmH
MKSESPVISNNSASPPNVQSTEGAQTSLDKGKDKQKSASHAAQLVGRVLVSSALASKTHPTDIVFIYAVPVSGSRMPLAMIKTTVDKLPYYFELNDTNAMNPAATLSSVDEVMVKARISVSGNAMPQPGDFGVTIGPVKVGAQNLNLTISEALK